MTEPQRKKLPPDMCPRCHGVKDPEDRLCEACLGKEEDFIAERTTTDQPGVYDTGLSKKEVAVLSGVIFAGMAGFVVAGGYMVLPQILDMFSSYELPPSTDILNMALKIGGGLLAEFVLFMIWLNLWKSYKKGLVKAAAEAAKGK